MKIGIDIRAMGRQRTGDESYTRDIVKHLLRCDRKNEYHLFTDTDDPSVIRRINEALGLPGVNLNAEIIPVFPSHKALWTFWSLPRHLAKRPVDVLHVQYITPQWLPKEVRLITTIHDISFNFFPEHIKWTDWVFLKSLIPLSLRRADKIIAVSQFTKNEIERYYNTDPGKVIAIHNAVGPEFHSQAKKDEIQQVIKKYQLPPRYILYVGTLQPRKNIPFLISAFAEFKKKHSGLKEIKDLALVIAGKRYGHNYDRKIDTVLQRLNSSQPNCERCILLPGYIDQPDLPALYQRATLFCSASLYEGFGIPLLEAMASGTPVLCSDSSCFPEIAGNAAILFKNNDMKDFTMKAYDGIMNADARRELKGKGSVRAKEFSWEKSARATAELFESFND